MARQISLLVVGALVILLSSTGYAGNTETMGKAAFAIKMNQVTFTDDVWKTNGLDEDYYYAFEGYGNITGNLYLGGEIGYYNTTGSVGAISTELTYVPGEFNLKYVLGFLKVVQIDVGGGFSINYVDGVAAPGTLPGSPDQEYLWGAQGLANVNIVIGRFFIGVNGKYQITEDVTPGANFNNYRIGGHIGFIFK